MLERLRKGQLDCCYAGTVMHILLSSMGAGKGRLTKYYFDFDQSKSEVKGNFSATALWQLLSDDKKPDEIWFLLTPKAQETAWPSIEEEAVSFGVKVKAIPLKGGSEANDASVFLAAVADELPAGTNLTLDITQGLRHHAFLFFALALYVSKFRSNKIEGIWYSRFETENSDDAKPIIDLKPVLELAHWFLAVSEFKDTGSLKTMVELVESKHKVRRHLGQLSREYLTGLPMEAGITAKKIVDILESTKEKPLADIPLESQIRELILAEIKDLAASGKHKEESKLTKDELERQARFIGKYLKAGQDNLAYGFMREWLINRYLEGWGRTQRWLSERNRSPIESQLGCLKSLAVPKKQRVSDAEEFPPEIKELGELWGYIIDIRNFLQHHGMDEKGFPKGSADKLCALWSKRDTWPELSNIGGGKDVLLICPLGSAAGVLYSALKHVKPARTLVICSEQTKGAIVEAIEQAGWKGEVKLLLLKDPHAGFEEFRPLLNQADDWLFQADSIEASLTGGTSLMGVLVRKLVDHANRTYKRFTREFVLIDKRSHEEQKNNPWALGERYYLDDDNRKAKR